VTRFLPGTSRRRKRFTRTLAQSPRRFRRSSSGLDRFLTLFTEVKAGEGVNALLLALNIFLILTAYYILKPVREALILTEGSAELKSYMSAEQVMLLAVLVPCYGRLAARFPRRRLINVVTAFFLLPRPMTREWSTATSSLPTSSCVATAGTSIS